MQERILKNSGYNNYNLNQVVSILTRLNTPGLTSEDLDLLNFHIKDCHNLIDKSNIDLVNENSEHRNAVQRNIEYTLGVCDSLKGRFPQISNNLRKVQWKLIDFLGRITSNNYLIENISHQQISEVFGFDQLLKNAQEKSITELLKWDTINHPNKFKLSSQLTMGEAKRITNFAITELLGVSTFPINFHQESEFQNHIIYRNKSQKGVNYIIPPFKIEEYISFDLPHNPTHLLHLSQLDGGVSAYVDEMEERCFFEGLAVLSEHLAVTSLEKSKSLSDDLYSCLEKANTKNISKQEFQDFVVNDRKFEFRLRATRLIADVLIVNGSSYEDTVNEVISIVGIDKNSAENEIKKYIAQPGLGAVYTLGYNKMLELGIQNPAQIISKSNPPKSRREFLLY